MDDSEEVYIVLSAEERAAVHAIQNRESYDYPVDWSSTARNLKVGEEYLKALCKIPLPKSNMIALSVLEGTVESLLGPDVALESDEERE